MRAIHLAFYVLLYSFSGLLITSPCARAWQELSKPEDYDIALTLSKTYSTHYKVYGKDYMSRPPLFVLHGGPGLSYDYLLPLSDLFITNSIPIIFYDQIGNGRSSHIPNAPPSFWTMDLFLDDLQNIIDYFNLYSGFSLFGHGWGSTVALEFALRRNPPGLKSLILSDGLPSMELYAASTGALLQDFPKYMQDRLVNGPSNLCEFESAFRMFYSVHGLRMQPQPKEAEQTLEFLFGPTGDPTVAMATQLTPQNWTVIDRLPSIKVKTLVLNGRYSVAQDSVVAPFLQYIPNVQYHRFEQSSQMPWWEEPEEFKKVMTAFLPTPLREGE